MRVLNVVQLLDPQLGGGTVERTLQMSRYLVRQGVECTVLTMEIALRVERTTALEGIEVVSLPCLNRRFHLPRTSLARVAELVEAVDVIHLMNHWTAINALVYRAARKQGRPYAICPAGALPVAGRSRLLKRIYNAVIGRSIVRHADRMIAISENEVADYLGYGGQAERVVLIPNGVDANEFVCNDRAGFLTRHGLPDRPFILFVGRLNRIKGPDLLLRAFLALECRFSDWQLVLVGPDEGMRAELESLVSSSGVGGRVRFLGFLGGEEKSAAYHAAELLVIPSRREAMSIVALEAGICGTPVLLTDECGFSAVESTGGGRVVRATVGELQAGLEEMLGIRPEARAAMGQRLRALVEREYRWEAVIRRYIGVYEELLRAQEGTAATSNPPEG